MRRSIARIVTIAALTTATIGGAPAYAQEPVDTSAWEQAAEQLFADPAQSDGPTAVYVGVYEPGTGWITRAYGESSPGVAASVGDHFPIGSLTKSVFATAVLQQVEKGVVGLQDTVRALDPDLAKRFPETAKWTVRDLLSMSTTIPDYADEALAKLVADPKRTFTRDDLIAMGIDEGEAVPAGGAYSTTNYIILGSAMWNVTGKSPAALVNEVLAEAGMDNSKLTPQGARPETATYGYVGTQYGADTEKVNPSVSATTNVTTRGDLWRMTWGREGGGAYSTIGDLGIWAKSCVGSDLLNGETVSNREKTHKIDAGNYGLGTINEGDWWGHSGQVIGYEALAFCNPETGQAVALAVNSSYSLAPAIGVLGAVAFPDYTQAFVESLFS
jgi:D-alanyl-D-alanine carboxypeptidase